MTLVWVQYIVILQVLKHTEQMNEEWMTFQEDRALSGSKESFLTCFHNTDCLKSYGTGWILWTPLQDVLWKKILSSHFQIYACARHEGPFVKPFTSWTCTFGYFLYWMLMIQKPTESPCLWYRTEKSLQKIPNVFNAVKAGRMTSKGSNLYWIFEGAHYLGCAGP